MILARMDTPIPNSLATPLLPHFLTTMLYFAYGSNMLTERLQARVPSAQPIASATVSKWSLRFHKQSTDGSGKCTMIEADLDSSTVHGVIFDMSLNELPTLDEAESRGRGYERRRVSPQTLNRTVDAFAYVAESAYVDTTLRPYAWYHSLVVSGAYQHNLPEAYRHQLKNVQTKPDPNTSRRMRHHSLLSEAGFLETESAN